MTTESPLTNHEHEHKQIKVEGRGGGADTVYSIGLIGAWVYYFKRATTNEERVKAFFKGFAWPAFLVYDLLVFLKKE